MTQAVQARRREAAETNKLRVADQAVHAWYRFVLSFPPHLVREYLDRFGIGEGDCVLDPFCGTGTTLVECKRLAIAGVGIESNPIAHFTSRVKLDWRPEPEGLLAHAERVAKAASAELAADGLDDIPPLRPPALEGVRLRTLPPEAEKLLLRGAISPLPLHKTLVLLEAIRRHHDARYTDHELLALAAILPTSVGNLQFGPEVGVGPPKSDAPVIDPWRAQMRVMARHLADLRPALRPGARLAYVVGDQASYLRVMIRTGRLLADIAESLGYEVVSLDLFRTRLATATKEQLREEVVVLRWPGRSAPFEARCLSSVPAGTNDMNDG